MSTTNFQPMNFNMPLIVNDPDDYEKCKESYEEQFEEEYTPEMHQDYLEWDIDTRERYLERLNEELKHFKVEVISGYYSGYQYQVYQTDDYWDYYDLPSMTDDDAEYYYGMNKQEVMAEFNQDLVKIREYLMGEKENGMLEIKLQGVFSNGEGVYAIQD